MARNFHVYADGYETTVDRLNDVRGYIDGLEKQRGRCAVVRVSEVVNCVVVQSKELRNDHTGAPAGLWRK